MADTEPNEELYSFTAERYTELRCDPRLATIEEIAKLVDMAQEYQAIRRVKRLLADRSTQ